MRGVSRQVKSQTPTALLSVRCRVCYVVVYIPTFLHISEQVVEKFEEVNAKHNICSTFLVTLIAEERVKCNIPFVWDHVVRRLRTVALGSGCCIYICTLHTQTTAFGSTTSFQQVESPQKQQHHRGSDKPYLARKIHVVSAGEPLGCLVRALHVLHHVWTDGELDRSNPSRPTAAAVRCCRYDAQDEKRMKTAPAAA